MRELRAPCWVEEDDGAGFWALTRHAHVFQASSTPRDFSCARGIRLEELDDDELAARRTMMEYDGAEHARLRRLAGAGFSRKSIAIYEESVRELAGSVLDRALELGALDFVEEVSRELPIRMLCRILGVPEEDAGELVEWGDALISNADPEFSMAVIDQEDTEAFRLLPFRSPAARSVFEYASRIRERFGHVLRSCPVCVFAARKNCGAVRRACRRLSNSDRTHVNIHPDSGSARSVAADALDLRQAFGPNPLESSSYLSGVSPDIAGAVK